MFKPNFRYTDKIVNDLIQISAARELILNSPFIPKWEVSLRREAQIPVEIRKAINDEGLLDLGGVYGDKAAGEQVEYDHLKLILADNTVEFEIFNRGLTLLMRDDEQVRRIHRVLCKLDKA